MRSRQTPLARLAMQMNLHQCGAKIDRIIIHRPLVGSWRAGQSTGLQVGNLRRTHSVSPEACRLISRRVVGTSYRCAIYS